MKRNQVISVFSRASGPAGRCSFHSLVHLQRAKDCFIGAAASPLGQSPYRPSEFENFADEYKRHDRGSAASPNRVPTCQLAATIQLMTSFDGFARNHPSATEWAAQQLYRLLRARKTRVSRPRCFSGRARLPNTIPGHNVSIGFSNWQALAPILNYLIYGVDLCHEIPRRDDGIL